MYIAAQCHVEGKEKEGVASKRTSETQNPPDDHPVFEKVHLKCVFCVCLHSLQISYYIVLVVCGAWYL